MERRPRTLVGSLVVLVALASAQQAHAEDALSSARVHDGIGVNVHATYLDTAYGNWDAVLAALRDLGVTHLRDAAVADDNRDYQAEYERRIQAAVAQGDRFDFLLGDAGDDPGPLLDVVLGRLRTATEALEGPNEPDLSTPALFPGGVRNYVSWLGSAVSQRVGSTIPLIAPSLGRAAHFGQLGLLSSAVPLVANLHYYNDGEQPTEASLEDALGISRQNTGPGGAAVITESGYHDLAQLDPPDGVQHGVPDDVAAAYLVRTMLEALREGVLRTYLYELVDPKPDPDGTDAEQHFGLLRDDFTPKPAYAALKRLLDAVGPAGSPTTAPLDLSVAGDAATRHLLVQTAAGTYLLALWQEAPLWDVDAKRATAPGDVPVTVSAPGLAAVRTLDPVSGSAGEAMASGGAARLTSSGVPTLVTLGFAPPTSVPAATTSVAAAPVAATPAPSVPTGADRPSQSSTPEPSGTSPSAAPASAAAARPSAPAVAPKPVSAVAGRRYVRLVVRGATQRRGITALRMAGAPAAGAIRVSLFHASGRGRALTTKVVRVAEGDRLVVHLRARRGLAHARLRVAYRPLAGGRFQAGCAVRVRR